MTSSFAKHTLLAIFNFQDCIADQDTSDAYEEREKDGAKLHAMQISANDVQSDGPAAVNRPAEAAGTPSHLNPTGAKEPRLRPQPTPIFKGKTFYIAPGLPSHFEANLQGEIKVSRELRLFDCAR